MRQNMHYENLPTVNRNVLVVVPTEVFLEWAKKNPDDDPKLSLEELVKDSTAYLIPEQDADAENWLKRNYRIIFEIELDGWCADPSLWPKDRSLKTFRKYFRVYYCSSVIDLGEDRIEREYL